MAKVTTVFDFQADVGLTKHLGSIESTEQLLALCGIDGDKAILDVGCGVGATPCYIAAKYGCRVVGVDISAGMVARSIERAEQQGLEALTEFRVADAQDLPFEDGRFDIVITESVTVFPEDKQKAVSEYVRVTKPGGYVGLNETTWLKAPVPPELVAVVKQDLSMNAEVQTRDGWVDLLENAGLTGVSAKTYPLKASSEFTGVINRYGCRGMLKVWARALRLYFGDPAYRAFLKGTAKSGAVPKEFYEYAGYGIYVGQKPLVETTV